jgi:AraC-like DNA-binding protein
MRQCVLLGSIVMAYVVHQPATALAQYVRYYVTIEDRLASRTFVQPIPARSTPLIDFQFGDPCEIAVSGQTRRRNAHSVAIVGAQTYQRVQLVKQGHVENFGIFFQPGGLFRLFATPLSLLTNQDYDGRAVIGLGIDELACRLGESTSAAERVKQADNYLLRRCPDLPSRTDISAIAREMLLHPGCDKVSELAVRSGLSTRQLERRFLAQIGVPPKTFVRVARFEAALRAKRQIPRLPWVNIAHNLGYHDQMHMVHDFREFSDATPSFAAEQLSQIVTVEIEGVPDPISRDGGADAATAKCRVSTISNP